MSKRLQVGIMGMGFLFLFLFSIFSYFIRYGFLQKMDFAFTIKLQEAIDGSSHLRLSRLTGDVMEGATVLASPMISIIFITIITIIIFIKSKKHRWRALAIPVFFILLTLAELYGKSVVHHPAPPFFLIKNPTTVFPKYYINEQFSYPSGHTARAVFIAVLAFSLQLSAFRRRKNTLIIGLLLASYVGLVSISRIYLGHHWLTDVIGGGLLGIGGTGLAIGTLLYIQSR